MEEIFQEPTGNIDGIDADALLSEIEGGGNKVIPMKPAEEPAPAEAPAPVEENPAAAVQEYEITWNGQKIKAPIDKLTQWASQGYDYSQKMAKFQQERQGWESQKSEFEKSITPYKTIDEYAKQNPQWWQHVESSYQQALQAGKTAESQGREVPAWVQEKLSKVEKFITDLEAEKTAKTREQEDSALDSEIRSIRDSFKNLDWDTPDESGQTLEQRVLKHAMDNGINSFRAAFRDYNHDQLVKLAEERGKENQTKELQKRTKLGILGESQAPKKGITPAEGVKNKSYEDLFQEALKEEGIA